jgi:hypothetical protein
MRAYSFLFVCPACVRYLAVHRPENDDRPATCPTCGGPASVVMTFKAPRMPTQHHPPSVPLVQPPPAATFSSRGAVFEARRSGDGSEVEERVRAEMKPKGGRRRG